MEVNKEADNSFRKVQLIVSAVLLVILVAIHAFLIYNSKDGLSIFIFGLIGVLGGFDISNLVSINKK